MRIFSISRASLALLSVALMLGGGQLRAQSADSEQISKLLEDARSHAMQAQFDAETLDSFTRSHISWQNYATQLNMIREHVNDLGKVVGHLNTVKGEGSPWQQTAIDRINPLLREMADQLTATLEFLKTHQEQVHMQPYQDYVHANYDVATRTANVINDLVEYGRAKSEAVDIQHRLELPPRS